MTEKKLHERIAVGAPPMSMTLAEWEIVRRAAEEVGGEFPDILRQPNPDLAREMRSMAYLPPFVTREEWVALAGAVERGRLPQPANKEEPVVTRIKSPIHPVGAKEPAAFVCDRDMLPFGMKVWPAADGGGRKDDQGKLPWHLLPNDAINEVLKVLQVGASTYGEYNWERGMDWTRVYDALMRHITAWHMGEDSDPATKLSHVAHAATNALFLLAYIKRSAGRDDRHHKKDAA